MHKLFRILSFLQSRYKSLLLVVLVSLFLMQRCGLLLSGYSHIAHPSFDEMASGVLACDLLDGQMRAPLFIYQYESRSGDGLIEGFLLVPFFKLLGRSLFSLKMLALFSALLSLLCWIIVIKRYHGMWAAIIFTSLFAFPPLMFARLNLMGTIASHHLINPLMAIQLLFLFLIIEGQSTKKTSWLWLGFGFLSGLGAYTFYTYIIFDSFCLLFLTIFRPGRVTFHRILLFSGGFFAGFSPWVARLLFSPAGGSYLASILKNIQVGLWSFIQNFGFNLPHSLGYHYPAHTIWIVSPLFCLFIVFLSGIILKGFFRDWFSLKSGSLKNKLENLSPSALQGIYFVIFPFFFLGCLSLSPMKISPFEYWPTIGFFGYFSIADVYRYRWLHPLFPFYFAIVAVGIAALFKSARSAKLCKRLVLFALVFFVLWSVVKSIDLYSKSDFGKLFCYKGYSYDQMGNRFMLGDMNRLNMEKAQQFTLSYPEENRGEAYRCLGTKVVLDILNNSYRDTILKEWLTKVPPPFLNDFIYGVVRAAQNISDEEFQPFKSIVVSKFPAAYYENWGFRHLAYKYYSLLLNREKILASIPTLEKWFFKHFLDAFNHEIHAHSRSTGENNLLEEISSRPIQHQTDVVRGVGMLVGAEMLFDPLLSLDYPLDSRYGEQLDGVLQEDFYEGVGRGFAETLCRFWRKLLLPQDHTSPLYEKMLDLEWERCHDLISKVLPSYAHFIKRGFFMELKRRHLDAGIRKYLDGRLLRNCKPKSGNSKIPKYLNP